VYIVVITVVSIGLCGRDQLCCADCDVCVTQPTSLQRTSWLVNPLDIRWYWIFAALLPALLATILIFMDQQITAVIVNRKENKLNVSDSADWLLLQLVMWTTMNVR